MVVCGVIYLLFNSCVWLKVSACTTPFILTVCCTSLRRLPVVFVLIISTLLPLREVKVCFSMLAPNNLLNLLIFLTFDTFLTHFWHIFDTLPAYYSILYYFCQKYIVKSRVKSVGNTWGFQKSPNIFDILTKCLNFLFYNSLRCQKCVKNVSNVKNFLTVKNLDNTFSTH